jgi:hypothetical protein
MAGGFSFPPPPPPPPRPTVQAQQPDFEYSQQAGRGGRGRGGFESRGRGGSGRGRGGGQGNSNFEPLGQHQRQVFNQGPTTAQPRERFEASINVQPPPGSHINPNFTGQRQGAPVTARTQPTPGYQDRHVSGSGEPSFNDARSSYTANRRLSDPVELRPDINASSMLCEVRNNRVRRSLVFKQRRPFQVSEHLFYLQHHQPQ